MSDEVFPTLAGLSWPVTRTPNFNTMRQTGSDLSELRGTFTLYPVYDITLTYDILRNDAHDEFRTLVGFFEQRLGSWDSFLFTDVDDYQVANQVFAVADGNTVDFPLIRTFGGSNTPVRNLNGAPTLTVNNVPAANYSITNGIVHFSLIPAANTVLRWTGAFYYRCRFSEDSVEIEKFMRLFWQAGQIKLRGSLGLAI